MSDLTTTAKRVPKAAWVIAYLISPAAPFICLRIDRAISTVHCILGVLAALIVHVGLVSVLAQTNNDPLQFFIALLLVSSIYLIVFWQYAVGQSASLWSKDAERQWRVAARFVGAVLALGLGVGIASFHMHRFTMSAEPVDPANQSQPVQPGSDATPLPAGSGR